jgi:hypothetical protein
VTPLSILATTLHNVADELLRISEENAAEPPRPIPIHDLPTRRPYLPCLWLDEDGRPHPVLAYRWEDQVHARLAAIRTTSYMMDATAVYPESAGPALWRAHLARQAGRGA